MTNVKFLITLVTLMCLRSVITAAQWKRSLTVSLCLGKTGEAKFEEEDQKCAKIYVLKFN